MSPDEYRNFLLANIPTATTVSGGSEIVCKCFDCPDDGQHYHMYISVPQTSEDLSFYHCFKCDAKGVVNQYILSKWGIYDFDFNVALSEHNTKVMKNPKNFRYNIDGICKLTYKDLTENQYSKRKLECINERLGTNLTFEDCINNKIVLNISDIFKQNKHIKELTRHENVIKALDKYFLGFISYDNNFINLKNLVYHKGILYDKLDDTRYLNYNIFGKEDNSMKFILYPTNINLDDPNPIKVHLAEGPFDALSVKYNLRTLDRYNNIFCAVTGNGFKGVLRHLIAGCKLMNLEIHLYPDNEPPKGGRPGTQDVINSIVDYLKPFGYPIYIHLNEIGKDMGVRLDQIKELKYQII